MDKMEVGGFTCNVQETEVFSPKAMFEACGPQIWNCALGAAQPFIGASKVARFGGVTESLALRLVVRAAPAGTVRGLAGLPRLLARLHRAATMITNPGLRPSPPHQAAAASQDADGYELREHLSDQGDAAGRSSAHGGLADAEARTDELLSHFLTYHTHHQHHQHHQAEIVS